MPTRNTPAGNHNRIIFFAAGILIFIASSAYVFGLTAYFKPLARQGVYFHYWNSSDSMMQNMPIKELKATPLQTLWYLHKQPPMLDGLRALIAVRHKNDADLITNVDGDLQLVKAFLFPVFVLLIYIFLFDLTRSVRISLLGASVWLLHPSLLFYLGSSKNLTQHLWHKMSPRRRYENEASHLPEATHVRA